jgi:arsenate reductase
MTQVTIYHNPRCSKSRQTLALLQERGIEPEVILYLQDPPDAGTLKRLLRLLDLQPRALMRRKEAAYQELKLNDETLSDDALIDAMAANPVLIERPIVVKGSRAVLGRPPENVLDLI